MCPALSVGQDGMQFHGKVDEDVVILCRFGIRLHFDRVGKEQVLSHVRFALKLADLVGAIDERSGFIVHCALFTEPDADSRIELAVIREDAVLLILVK